MRLVNHCTCSYMYNLGSQLIIINRLRDQPKSLYIALTRLQGHSRSQVKVTGSNIPVVLVPSPEQVLVAEPTTPNPGSQVTVATVPNGLLSVIPVL